MIIYYCHMTIIYNHGANINAEDNDKETPLHYTCMYQDEKNIAIELLNIAIELLNRNAKVNVEDKYNQTPLHYACEYGTKEMIVQLLKYGASVFSKGDIGETPLHIASRSNTANVIAELLNHGANVNAETQYNQTPLYNACISCMKENVVQLLNHGANVNIIDGEKQSPLHYSIYHIRAMINNGGISSTKKIVIELLNSGADVNAVDNENRTPLHYVYSKRNNTCGTIAQDVIVELLKRGANPYIKDNMGYSVYDAGDTEIKDLIRRTMVEINWKKVHRIILLKILFDKYTKDFLHRYYIPGGKGHNLAKSHFEESQTGKVGVE